MKTIVRFVLFVALSIYGHNMFAQDNNFRVITEDENGIIKIINEFACPYDISDNKKHVVIQAYGEFLSYYWSEETGVISIDGYCFSVSDEGVVAGYYVNEEGYSVAGLWYPETKEWEFLGMNPVMPEFIPDNLEYNQAWAMSNDGTTVGVMQFDESWNTATYLWTERNGYVQLPNGGSNMTRPHAINDDATVVAGIFTDDIGYRAPCYWADGEIHQISSYSGEAMNVSSNGRYVCGNLKDSKSSAFIYDITNEELTLIENTFTDLLGGMTAMCVTDNGDAFGYISVGHNADYNSRRGFAYVEGELMLFEDYLITNGVQDAESWKVYSVNSVTSDGKTFIGAAEMKGEDYTFALTIGNAECDAPTNLTCVTDENDGSSITLSWDAPENPVDVTYEIYNSYTAIDPLFYGLTENSITIDNLAPGNYRFLVKANWGDECLSNPTNAIDVTIYPCSNKEMCELTFNMLDGYGDGWNGGFIEIRSASSDFSYKVGLEKEGLEVVTKTLSLCPDNYTFIWNMGDFDEELSFTIIFNDEEIFKVEAGDINALFGTFFLEYEIDCEGDNVNDIEQNSSFNLYPNPVEDELFLATELRVEEIAIYDIYGRLCRDASNASTSNASTMGTMDTFNVSVQDLDAGVYFVKIKTDDGNIVKRFIKQ